MRKLFRYGAYMVGTAALVFLLYGILAFFGFIVGRADAQLGLSLIAVGVGMLNTALLLRVVRWEVNER